MGSRDCQGVILCLVITVIVASRISQGPSNTASSLGQTVTLTCVEGDGGTDNQRWTKDGGIISQNEMVIIEDPAYTVQAWNLRMSGLRMNHSGYYQCVSLGLPTDQQRGAWLVGLGDTECGFNSNNFSCQIEYNGDYPPTLQVYKNGQVVPHDGSSSVQGHVVRAEINATQDDGHVYGCRMYFRPPADEGLTVQPHDDSFPPNTNGQCGHFHSPSTDGGPAQVTESQAITTVGSPPIPGGNVAALTGYRLVPIVCCLLLTVAGRSCV